MGEGCSWEGKREERGRRGGYGLGAERGAIKEEDAVGEGGSYNKGQRGEGKTLANSNVRGEGAATKAGGHQCEGL